MLIHLCQLCGDDQWQVIDTFETREEAEVFLIEAHENGTLRL